MDNAVHYTDLKARVARLEAQSQFWKGRREAHEANKSSLLAEAQVLGVKGEDLDQVKEVLEKELAAGLADLESKVVLAEQQFLNLRRDHVDTET